MLRVGSRLHHATVVDISQGGAKLEFSGPVDAEPVDAEDVSLRVPGLPEVKGVIRWSADGRAGVAFDESMPVFDLLKWLAPHQQRINAAVTMMGVLTVSCAVSLHPATAQRSATMSVGATVVDSCAVSSPVKSGGQVKVTCTPGTSWSATQAEAQARPPGDATAAPISTEGGGRTLTIRY